MAIYYARKSGNVNAADVWATTPTGVASDAFSLFTNQDTLISNSFTITLNVNTTVLEIRNDTAGGATNGGSFTINAGVTLNANCISGSAALITYGGSSTIIGNIISNGGITITINSGSSGTLNIIGTLNSITGNALFIGSNIAININGNIIAGSTRAVYIQNANPTINITGNLLVGGVGTAFETFHSTTANGGVLNITGNITGGNAAGLNIGPNYNVSATIIGVVTGGTGAPGVNISATSSVIIITRAKGNGFGSGSVGMTSQVGVLNNTQAAIVRVSEIEYGALGQSPTSGPIELVTSNSNVAVFATRLGLPKTLVDLNNATNLVPTSGNVRSGTSYNYGNNIGSCVIPNPNSVVYGVSVDNTVGSGLLSPVAVWNALTSSIGTTGSIGERLKNVSTVSTVGKQLEGVL